MSLSARFDKMPAPQYESMPAKASGNGPKRTKSKKQTPNASGPQIIRPNVSNLTMKKGNKTRKRKMNPNQNPFLQQNQRKQQKVANTLNNAARGSWSEYQPVVTTNRGRGFNQPPAGGLNGGYRSYRTQGGPQRFSSGPYQRPQQNFQQTRHLPSVHKGYPRGGNVQRNGFRGNGFSNENNFNQFNQGGYLSNKRQNYYKMKSANNGKSGGGGKAQNNSKGPRSGKFSNRQTAKPKVFKKAATAEELDRELDSYLMRNPNAEERTSTMSSHLDKELDDYFNSQQDAGPNKE